MPVHPLLKSLRSTASARQESMLLVSWLQICQNVQILLTLLCWHLWATLTENRRSTRNRMCGRSGRALNQAALLAASQEIDLHVSCTCVRLLPQGTH